MGYALIPNCMNQDVPTIESYDKPLSKHRIGHIAVYTHGNAGDTLLPRTVRDVIDGSSSASQWVGIHVHRNVGRKLTKEINTLNGLIIGGGGLFLRDTNPNNMSGWQWNCSIDALKRIEIPIALYAVGYNRFRKQLDFNPVFRKHLELLAEKCIYIGLRNSGSIRAISSYLPKELKAKVRFQPCPTTLCSKLYPKHCAADIEQGKPVIGLNCAFDRIEMRLGKRAELILTDLADAMKILSEHCIIKYYSHTKSDHQMLPYLNRVQVPYELVDLMNLHPREVMKAYVKPNLVIGMRGHAQMIPFGCGTPILSLVSHDKVKWFLDDIKRPEWGIEMTICNFKNKIIESALDMLDRNIIVRDDIQSIQLRLLDISRKNALDFIARI